MSNFGPSRREFLTLLAGAAASAKTTWAGAQPAPSSLTSSLPLQREFLIRAGHLVSMDPNVPDFAPGDIHVRDGQIVAVGQNLDITSGELIDASEMIVLPGFVDTHLHCWNGILRGLISRNDPKFSYFPLTQRAGGMFTPLDSYHAVRLCVAEALASGITTLNDWSHNTRSPAHADAELSALVGSGIRARFSYGWGMDYPLSKPIDLNDVARVKREWLPRSDLITLGLALRTAAEGGGMQRGNVPMDVLKEEFAEGRRLALPLSMHMRIGSVALLEKEQLLGPDLQLVHPLGFTQAEREAVARSRAVVSISPSTELSAMSASMGHIQYAELAELGVQLALSVDTTGTSGNADFFSCMRGLMWSHGQRNDTKASLTMRRLLELATIEGARQLGIDDRTGSLTPGKRADMIMVRSTDANLAPVFDPVTALVVSGTSSNVDTVMVDGRILRRQGRSVAIDEREVVREAAETARRLAAML
jgi:5-methylthioadenosine/S-adenosylhomocysteine deaminase